eukprot:6396702-Prorocentrum_lima.AAC.1
MQHAPDRHRADGHRPSGNGREAATLAWGEGSEHQATYDPQLDAQPAASENLASHVWSMPPTLF